MECLKLPLGSVEARFIGTWREGTVKVGPGYYCGRGWGRAAVDALLGSFLAPSA